MNDVCAVVKGGALFMKSIRKQYWLLWWEVVRYVGENNTRNNATAVLCVHEICHIDVCRLLQHVTVWHNTTQHNTAALHYTAKYNTTHSAQVQYLIPLRPFFILRMKIFWVSVLKGRQNLVSQSIAPWRVMQHCAAHLEWDHIIRIFLELEYSIL